MDDDALTVKVEVPRHLVNPSLLERFAKALKDLTEGVSDSRWAFTSITVNSLDTAVRPLVGSELEMGREFERLAAGLMDVEKRKFPQGWDPGALAALETLNDMAKVTIGVGSRLPSRPLTRIAEGAKSLLSEQRVSIGSVEGVIESVNLHGSPRFGVLEDSSGKVVQVGFASHHESNVLDLFHARTRVLARGRLFRNAAGAKERLTLKTLRPLGERSRLSVREVVGALGDLPEGVDSVEWIRRQRG